MSNRYRNSRANRWEEITHQEQLILAKKREIEERLKSSEDKDGDSSKKDIPSSNSNNFNSPSTISNSTSTIPLSSLSSSSQISPTSITIKPLVASSSSDDANDSNVSGTADNADKLTFINKFSNDGSFMEMFKKMQQKNSHQSCSSNSTIVKKEDEPQSSSVNPEPPKLEDIDERIRSSIKQEPSESEESKKVSPSGDDEIRMAIEKSAIYVAMNGSEAEARLRSDSVNDSNYRWLYQQGSVNHQYYKRRVAELKEAKSRAADFELSSSSSSSPLTQQQINSPDDTASSCGQHDQDERQHSVDVKVKKRKESRWSSEPSSSQRSDHEDDYQESSSVEAPQDPELIKYAIQVYGKCDLTTDQWKQLEDQRKMKVLVAMLQKKKAKRAKFEASGRPMYEYDSDEEIDVSGTWEHKKRMEEMEKTKEWADQLTEMNKGKHHIGDFLPPDQLERFMKKWDSIKDGSTSVLFDEDYQDFKLQSQNQGYKMLEKLGWTDGQGLGVDNKGITKPVDADGTCGERAGLGQKRPDQLKPDDDEYEAYRKRMMLAYRFRPNPLNNPRRPYY